MVKKVKTKNKNGKGMRIGDLIVDLVIPYAEKEKNSAVAKGIRDGTLPGEKYTSYLAALYPIVTGFNGGLKNNLTKVDHVENSGLVRILAEQLAEEQKHNDLWRQGLEERGINHRKLHDDFEAYLGIIGQNDLDQMHRAYLRAISKSGNDLTPGVFPKTIFPEPIIALEYQLKKTSSPEHDFYEHFGSQLAIEAFIYDVVSNFYDGLVGGNQFRNSPSATQWFYEHAAQNEGSDEQKHLDMSQKMLNRSSKAHDIRDKVLEQVENTVKLFAATVRWHNNNKFDVGEYKN